MNIKKPTFVIDKSKTIQKIKALNDKFKALNIDFRPHFKTHNSIEVGSWFLRLGIEKITVSSVGMAEKFVKAGWQDILIAFPVNVLEIDAINYISERCNLTLLIDNVETAFFLEKHLKQKCNVYVEIDTGKGRSGRSLDHPGYLEQIGKYLQKCNDLEFLGILTHSGHSYEAKSKEEIISINHISLAQMRAARALFEKYFDSCRISYGDTPTAYLADIFPGADEIRPGVFVFFDLMMWKLGVCKIDEISAYVVAPICGIYPERNQHNLLIYSGAVHLSKESIKINGKEIYGKIVKLDHQGAISQSQFDEDIYITQLSQEHAMCDLPKKLLNEFKPGDLLGILPVHACLTANILDRYLVL
jgi:D-serine deaminase-like pyridoxal phosphate-dependent protein